MVVEFCLEHRPSDRLSCSQLCREQNLLSLPPPLRFSQKLEGSACNLLLINTPNHYQQLLNIIPQVLHIEMFSRTIIGGTMMAVEVMEQTTMAYEYPPSPQSIE